MKIEIHYWTKDPPPKPGTFHCVKSVHIRSYSGPYFSDSLNHVKAWHILFKAEAVAQRCSLKKVLIKSLQNFQENTRVRAFVFIKLQASKIFKNLFFNRTNLVAIPDIYFNNFVPKTAESIYTKCLFLLRPGSMLFSHYFGIYAEHYFRTSTLAKTLDHECSTGF